MTITARKSEPAPTVAAWANPKLLGYIIKRPAINKLLEGWMKSGIQAGEERGKLEIKWAKKRERR